MKVDMVVMRHANLVRLTFIKNVKQVLSTVTAHMNILQVIRQLFY
jgi:hypothetical protein